MVSTVKKITAKKATLLFFKKVFPDHVKNRGTGLFKFDYFQEWVDRFKSGTPERWCDLQSLKAISALRKKGYKW
jgi:hypothetical protein